MIEKSEAELFKALEWLEAHSENKFNKKLSVLIRNYAADVTEFIAQQMAYSDSLLEDNEKMHKKHDTKVLRNNITGKSVGYFSSNYQL